MDISVVLFRSVETVYMWWIFRFGVDDSLVNTLLIIYLQEKQAHGF